MKRSASLAKRPLALGTTRFESDGRITVARFGPLDADAGAAITRHSELAAPAKLSLAPGGKCELQAEVLRVDDADTAKLARSALDIGRAWLSGESPSSQAPQPDDEDLAAALAELPETWVWERGEAGAFQVHATAFGESVRLMLRTTAGGAQVIARSALPTPDPAVGRALVHFALETNRRLRLARIGVSTIEGETCAVTWDAVTPAGVDLAGVVPATVEAVVRAHAATRRSMRALAHVQIAAAYLDARDPAPRRRRSAPRG
jgi:hypothetical protein